MNMQSTQINRLLAVWVLTLGCISSIARATEEKPDLPSIEKKSLELLQLHLPQPTQAGEINFPDKTKIIYGPLFDEGIVAVLNFLPRPINDREFDYPPCFLSFARYSENAWRYVQYLGSASQYELHERKDLKLKIIQGSCQTARNESEQASWKWDPNSLKFIPTGLDDWGRFNIVGDFIVYQRGHERLSHWNTRWIYRYKNGKRHELVTCFHEEDVGRWTISFRMKPSDNELTHWAFLPDLDIPDKVLVRSVPDEESFDGEEIGRLKLQKGTFLEQGYCFELLTGLSANLLDELWVQELPNPTHKKRQNINVTGSSEIMARFQWPKQN